MLAPRAILIILDGWGHGPNPKVSAIAQANTPVMDQLYKDYPNSELITYGEEVGLPEGQMGNSEVGHLNIGAGRVVYQELARINKAIRDRSFHENPALLKALAEARLAGRPVHLMGLVSDGGVHSHIDHLKALCDICEEQGLEKVFIHAFTDGRDTDPKSGKGFIAELQKHISDKSARLASIIGRYFAMDRDKRWERVRKAYDLLVKGVGEPASDPLAAIEDQYARNITDEFLEPILCTDEQNEPVATLQDGDVVVFFNFRTDRPRQITRVLCQEDMPEFGMKKLDLTYLTMSRYDETFRHIEVLFEKEDVRDTLGEFLSQNGKKQIRIAETEKYPHVTFFFNGGREEPFEGESRILIPSPKVATYDLQPEMSAPEITEAITGAIREQKPDFICLNYANTDMVGHTGVFEAAMKASETVDHYLGQLLEVALANDYAALIIADHGNSDFMVNEDGSPNTAHTKNPVPCILVSNSGKTSGLRDGRLADVAPTLLHILGLTPPDAMTGHSLIV